MCNSPEERGPALPLDPESLSCRGYFLSDMPPRPAIRISFLLPPGVKFKACQVSNGATAREVVVEIPLDYSEEGSDAAGFTLSPDVGPVGIPFFKSDRGVVVNAPTEWTTRVYPNRGMPLDAVTVPASPPLPPGWTVDWQRPAEPWHWPEWLTEKWIVMEFDSSGWIACNEEPIYDTSPWPRWRIPSGCVSLCREGPLAFTPPPCTDWRQSKRRNPRWKE